MRSKLVGVGTPDYWNASIVMSDRDDTCYEPGSSEIPFDSDSTYISTTPTGTCTGGDINDQTQTGPKQLFSREMPRTNAGSILGDISNPKSRRTGHPILDSDGIEKNSLEVG